MPIFGGKCDEKGGEDGNMGAEIWMEVGVEVRIEALAEKGK